MCNTCPRPATRPCVTMGSMPAVTPKKQAYDRCCALLSDRESVAPPPSPDDDVPDTDAWRQQAHLPRLRTAPDCQQLCPLQSHGPRHPACPPSGTCLCRRPRPEVAMIPNSSPRHHRVEKACAGHRSSSAHRLNLPHVLAPLRSLHVLIFPQH